MIPFCRKLDDLFTYPRIFTKIFSNTYKNQLDFHEKYANNASSTSKSNETLQVSLEYGSGSAMGFLSEDTVRIGNMSATSQRFVEVIKSSEIYKKIEEFIFLIFFLN